MPISEDKAAEVAGRLSVMPGFPRTDEAVESTVKLLGERLTPVSQHIEAFVKEILEEYDSMPSPRALMDIARKTEPEKKTSFGCAKCDYSGFLETTITRAGRTASASAPCDCRLHPAPDPEEWEPRVNSEGTTGPVSAQVGITRDWADELAAKIAQTKRLA